MLRTEHGERFLVPRTAIAFVVGMAILAGCTTSRNSSESSQETSSPAMPQLPFVERAVTFDNLNCDHPCVLPIYKRPQDSKKTIDKVMNRFQPTANNRAWPNEAAPDNRVRVVCQVVGQKLHDDMGNTSDIWDVVEMTAEPGQANTANEVAVGETHDGSAVFGHQREKLYGFVADIWVGNKGITKSLAACTAAQDPERNPAVY